MSLSRLSIIFFAFCPLVLNQYQGPNQNRRRHHHGWLQDGYQQDRDKLNFASGTLNEMVKSAVSEDERLRIISEANSLENNLVAKSLVQIADKYTGNGTKWKIDDAVMRIEGKLDILADRIEQLKSILERAESEYNKAHEEMKIVKTKVLSIEEKMKDQPAPGSTLPPVPVPAPNRPALPPGPPYPPAPLPRYPRPDSGDDDPFGSHLSFRAGPLHANIPGVGEISHGQMSYSSSLGRNHDGYQNQKTMRDEDLVNRMTDQVLRGRSGG